MRNQLGGFGGLRGSSANHWGRFGTSAPSHPNHENFRTPRSRSFGSDDADLGVLLGDPRPRLRKIVAHEDLTDEVRPGLSERRGYGERLHEQLEAARLIADLGPAGVRGHVAQDDVVR